MAEEKNEEQHKIDWNVMVGVFMMFFGLGIGANICQHFDWQIDLEKKSYVPYEVNGDLYLINSKNGKTYLLEKQETKDHYWYEYKFLAKTKTKNTKIYDKKNPLKLAF